MSSSQAPYSAVLFDHDGVLVASESLHRAAWEKLFKELDLPYHEAELRAMVGKTAPQTLELVLNRHRPGWGLEQYPLDQLALQKNDYFLKFATQGGIAYPGVVEGLKWLRRNGIKSAVVSNAKRRELDAVLGSLDLLPWIDLVLSRDDVRAHKPDSLPYLTAAAQLGIDPDLCLAVEDSPPGIESALMGKIPSAAVLTSFSREVMSQPVAGRPDLKPVWIGETIAELFQWLSRGATTE